MTDTLGVARQCAIALPCWSAPVDPQPLAGGMSNHNFTVEHGGRRYMVRIGGDQTVHNVMRFNEHTCARAAAAVGLTPRVVFAQEQALVTDFIVGRTWQAADVALNLPRVIALLQQLHREGAHALRGPVLAFSPFHVVRHYAKLLDEGGSRMRSDLQRFVALADECETVAGISRAALCHNDLLAANVIDSGERLWLIDWEHAGLGAPLFDLANLAANNTFDEACEVAMLEQYFATAVTPQRWRALRAMRTMSHLREAMWSLASELHSDIDFDFVAYSDENLRVFEAALGDLRAT